MSRSRADVLLEAIALEESTALIQKLADEAGVSPGEMERSWTAIKRGLLQSKKESDDSFYPIVVSTLKKKYGLK